MLWLRYSRIKSSQSQTWAVGRAFFLVFASGALYFRVFSSHSLCHVMVSVSCVCLHLWTRVWGFQNVGQSEESVTAVSCKTPYCGDALTAEPSPVTRMSCQALEIPRNHHYQVLPSFADNFIGYDCIVSIGFLYWSTVLSIPSVITLLISQCFSH